MLALVPLTSMPLCACYVGFYFQGRCSHLHCVIFAERSVCFIVFDFRARCSQLRPDTPTLVLARSRCVRAHKCIPLPVHLTSAIPCASCIRNSLHTPSTSRSCLDALNSSTAHPHWQHGRTSRNQCLETYGIAQKAARRDILPPCRAMGLSGIG